MRVGVALGSNLGDRAANLRAARNAIIRVAGVMPPILSSGMYETDPVDCEPGAEKFLNAVLEFSYDRAPSDLFANLKQVEIDLGRPSAHARNVSRPIDVDLLYFDEMTIENENLRVPHPRMFGRRFVLEPLAEIRPDLVLPDQTKTVLELLASLDQSAKVTRLSIGWEKP